MRNKKAFLIAVSAILFSFTLSACGGGGGLDNSGKTAPTSNNSGQSNTTSKPQGIVEDIKIKTTPKTEYVLGEEFEITGGIINLYYEDGTISELGFESELVMVSVPNMNTTGVKNVVVDYDGFIDSYQITIRNPSYLVTFDLNYEGAPEATVTSVEVGNYLVRPLDPQRVDYRFLGWFIDKEGNEEFDFVDTLISSNMILYAKWVQEISVSFDLDDGTAIQRTTVSLNSIITIIDAPNVLRNGYEFLGWYVDEECYQFNTPITTSILLKAKWQEIIGESCKVTISLNAGEGYQDIEYYVAKGSTTFIPDDVVIEGKEFLGWYDAPYGNTPYNFTTPINDDVTIYAHYVVNFYTINFKYVINGIESIFRTQQVEPGKKASKVNQVPRVENYKFNATWYNNIECTTLFDFNTEIYSDYDLYIKPLKKNLFEAEYTHIDENKPGVGSSDTFVGLLLIYEDNGTAESSNGYWVSGLYYNGAFVEFVINSEKAVNDATIEMGFSSEWADSYIAPINTTIGGQSYHAVEIANYAGEIGENGELLHDSLGYALYDESSKQTVDYQPIALEGAIPFSESAYDKRPFENYTLSTTFSLYEGFNVIRLTVKNSVAPFDGTMNANAPMVDYLTIYTDSTLTWNPKEENVADWTAINFAPNKHGM